MKNNNYSYLTLICVLYLFASSMYHGMQSRDKGVKIQVLEAKNELLRLEAKEARLERDFKVLEIGRTSTGSVWPESQVKLRAAPYQSQMQIESYIKAYGAFENDPDLPD